MTFEENASLVLTAPPSEQDEMLPADPTNLPHEPYEPELWQEIDDHHHDEIRRMQADTDPWLIISSL